MCVHVRVCVSCACIHGVPKGSWIPHNLSSHLLPDKMGLWGKATKGGPS